jgi:DNA-directed RNA polymerase subunit RPC12/RpoP
MALTTCADCGKPISSLAPACPHCGLPITASARSAAAVGPVCPYCGSHQVGKVRGVQGFGEVIICMILFLLFIIPGVIYYVYMESIPYCSGCGRRVRF